MSISDAAMVAGCIEQLFPVRQPFAARFYRRLFDEMPEVREMFVHELRRQEMMLFAVISMVLKGLEADRDMYGEMFEFGRIHRRAGVREEMFPVFGAVFLEVLHDFLPDHDQPGLAQAWWRVFTSIYEAIVDGMRTEDAGQQPPTPWLIDGTAAQVA